jgi:hypothetical protein
MSIDKPHPKPVTKEECEYVVRMMVNDGYPNLADKVCRLIAENSDRADFLHRIGMALGEPEVIHEPTMQDLSLMADWPERVGRLIAEKGRLESRNQQLERILGELMTWSEGLPLLTEDELAKLKGADIKPIETAAAGKGE